MGNTITIKTSPQPKSKSDKIKKLYKKVITIVMVTIMGFTTYFFGKQYLNRKTAFCFPDTGNDYVVVLHGLGRTKHSMGKISKHLSEKGYTVVNAQYPSNMKDLEALAKQDLSELISVHCPDKSRKLNFVTHSMGGILVRQFLKENMDVERIGRVVMLAPPNGGSEIIDGLREYKICHEILGPAGMSLGTREMDKPKSLGPINAETGVVMGDMCLFPLGWVFIDEPNDGAVAVKNAPIEGMKEGLLVNCTHTFMIVNNTVIGQVEYFLRNGEFDRRNEIIKQI